MKIVPNFRVSILGFTPVCPRFTPRFTPVYTVGGDRNPGGDCGGRAGFQGCAKHVVFGGRGRFDDIRSGAGNPDAGSVAGLLDPGPPCDGHRALGGAEGRVEVSWAGPTRRSAGPIAHQ